ncbi:MAG: hypothetical protein HYZ72_18765 [Deltaproteobacteria bacterium]|nr:hypothetical protein [Deltaproteobacteria bacterium]
MAFYDQHSDASNFVISWTREPRNDFGIFSKGYTRAAERLATLLLEAPRFSDYEAYPVVFLYRHALELSLKHVIYRSVELAAYRYIDDIGDRLHNVHDLFRLAKTASASLTLLFPEDEFLRKVASIIDNTCAELSELDPDSYAYRYPIDKKGRPSTKKNQRVNLAAFATHMSSLLEDLDTVHFGLSGEIYIAQDALYETVRSNLCAGA